MKKMIMTFIALSSLFSIAYAGQISHGEYRGFAISQDGTKAELKYVFQFDGGSMNACQLTVAVTNRWMEVQNLSVRVIIDAKNVYGEETELVAESSQRINNETILLRFDQCIENVADRMGNVLSNSQTIRVLLNGTERIHDQMKMAW